MSPARRKHAATVRPATPKRCVTSERLARRRHGTCAAVGKPRPAVFWSCSPSSSTSIPDKGTRGQGDKGTRGQGDKGTRTPREPRALDSSSLCPLVPLSPCPLPRPLASGMEELDPRDAHHRLASAGRIDGRREAGPVTGTRASVAGLSAVSAPGRPAPASVRPGADGRRPRLASADAALPHLAAAGQGPLHDRRPGRPGRELRRVHAPGRLRRAAGHQPDLDRAAAHRAAADRSDRAHGERDPEVPAQRVRDDRGVQRAWPARSPSRSASWSSPTSRPTSATQAAAPAGQHRQQRRALRRLRPDQRSTPSSPLPPGFQLKDLETALRQHDLEGGPASAGASPNFGRFPLALDAPPDADAVHRDLCTASATRPATPTASRCRSSSSRPSPTSTGRATAASGVDVPLGRAGATKLQHLQAGQGHLAARADRRQDRLGQVDAAARPDHQPARCATAPTSSSST